MKTRKLATVILVLLMAYIIWPYYSTWKLLKAVNSGEVNKLNAYINFTKVRASLISQVDSVIEQQKKSGDVLVAEMMISFRPMMENLVDKAIQPENIAEFIERGNLQKINPAGSKNQIGENNNKISGLELENISWHAFLDRPSRFKVTLENLVMFMEPEGFNWRVTAIGVEDLLNQSHAQRKQEFVSDEIDIYPPVIPVPVDIQQVKEDIANAFFVENDFSNSFSLRGEFYYVPVGNAAPIDVELSGAVDFEGGDALAEFSEEKKLEREKFDIGNRLNLRVWSDIFPKVNDTKKIAKVIGKASLVVPTKVEKYVFNKNDINQLHQQELSSVNLTAMRNGNVSLSLYWDFDQSEVEPLVIIRNEQREVLAVAGSSWMTQNKEIKDNRFKIPVRGENRQIRVKGTPFEVEVYFPLNLMNVESGFVAYPKAMVATGVSNPKIMSTRYDRPISLPHFIAVKKTDLEREIEFLFVEKRGWDNKWHRSVELVFPKWSNTELAEVDFSGLRISTVDTESWVDEKAVQKYKRGNIFGANFYNKNQYDGAFLPIDLATGVVRVSYPSTVDLIDVLQGEKNTDGVVLEGARLTYPKKKGYSKVVGSLNSTFVVAYDSKGRRIALLEDKSFLNKDNYEVYFWGAPSKVTLHKVSGWLDLEIPKAFLPQDLKRIE